MKYPIFLCFTATVMSILLSGCAPVPDQLTPAISATPTVITNILESTNTSESSIISSQTSTSIPVAVAELKCPSLDSDMQFNFSSDPTIFETSVLNYLNMGGDPSKIEPTSSPPEVPPFYIAVADLDGDLLSEVVVSTRDLFEQQATIRIFRCGHNNYRLAKSFTRQSMSFGIIEFVTNLFPSESHFVIIRATRIAGWGQDYIAVGWHDSEWKIINLATGTTPSEIALFDQNMDGTKEVYIKTKTSATPGGGISRVVLDSYSWNGKEFILAGSNMPPGSDRVHFLQDAESAWEQGSPLLAVSYYEVAARDSNLSSYWTTYELINKQISLAKPYQQAYAFFRIVAIWLYLDRPEVTSHYIQEMSDAFPHGTPGNEFVLAARELSNWYEKNSDFFVSCGKAVDLLDAQYPDIIRNHLGDWGVANPMYFATSDICKLK